MLKPLPLRDPARLLVIREKNLALHKFDLFVAPANFRLWQHCGALAETAAIQDTRMDLTAGPNGHMEPEELMAERVTASLFPLLGVQPVIGRAFRPEEDRPDHANYVLLSHDLWQHRFGSDSAIAGKTVRLAGASYTVLGVLPAGFAVLDPDVDLWVPLALDPNDTRIGEARMLAVVARLKPDATIEQARAELEGIGTRAERDNPRLDAGFLPSVFPFREEVVGRKIEQALLVLLAAVGFLLLMACANVANLLLARGVGRQRELAVRAALGATRGRLLAQLLSESILLAVAGGAAGMVLAYGGVALLARLGEQSVPRLAEARVDARLFLFALAISVLTGALFGIAPAIQLSGTNLRTALTESGRGGTAARSGRMMRNALVVAELALGTLVLIGAGLLLRSFVRLESTDPGFQPAGLLTMRVPLGGAGYSVYDRRIAFFQQLVERAAALPGVRGAAATSTLPLTNLGVGSIFHVDGRPAPPPEQRPIALVRGITPDYFRVMGIPLLAGRAFTAADTATAPLVAVVNQTLARRFWPGPGGTPSRQPAIGGRLLFDPAERVIEIVGIVGDVKPDHMDSEVWPTVYTPYPQLPMATMAVVVRTSGPALLLASAVERLVHQLDPDQPVAQVRSMDAVVDRDLASARFNTVVLGLFALVAFALAAVGIYGVISYDVTQRVEEIGIRAALGAQPHDIVRLVLGQGAALAASGIAAGLVAAFAITRVMATMLYGTPSTDALTFAAIALLLGAVALTASYVPARRAMALDPVAALRHQ